MSPTGEAASYFVDRIGGSDKNSGTSARSAWYSLSQENIQRLGSGDTLYLKGGQTWNETLDLTGSGDDNNPISVTAYGKGRPVLYALKISASHLRIENLIIDHGKREGDAVVISGGEEIILANLEVRNGTGDGVDIRDGRNILISGAHIHHFLAGSFNEQKDAHGIVATNTQHLTIENTEIHQVSGDSFQADPGRDAQRMSNDVTIKNSHFWTAPLTRDFNGGWLKTNHLPESARQYPGENAIDTKVVKTGWESAPRMKLTVNNLTAHGWKRDGFIRNKAAFNIKEKVAAVFDGVKVYDSEIAFRLRGNRGNADVSIRNTLIYHCEKAIRAEDYLQNLRVTRSTFGFGIGNPLQIAGGRGDLGSWRIRDNILVEKKPRRGFHYSNVLLTREAALNYFVAPLSGDYRPRRRPAAH